MLRSPSPTRPTFRRRRRRRQQSPSPLAAIIILLSCYYCRQHLAGGESTIPRSTNRYSDYNRQSSPSSSSAASISSSFSPHDYHPPWNPSPKIDPNGFLSDLYHRTPGEWEHLANIRGKYGPRSKYYPRNLLSIPVEIRQVPGDGNCLFHSIAACLFYTENDGMHLPMDSHERILELRCKSLELRNAAVDVLHNVSHKGRRKLFLQGEEYLEARELLAAAAAQFELQGEEYCELMRKESYWGGGPEIVALCNYLQRPIHIYELVPTSKTNNNSNSNTNEHNMNDEDDSTNNDEQHHHAKNTCSQFTLRRMACFGSPRYDRREPLHILSADSRFPDVEPKRIRRVGNHFLALFPVTKSYGVGGGLNQFRNHALLRGGSRIVPTTTTPITDEMNDEEENVRKTQKKAYRKWDGGRGRWAKNNNNNEAEKQ
ncbi:hypothetical protein ACHAXM_010883 [Skeletonema potamos]